MISTVLTGLVIELEARSILSLVGIVLLIVGVWHVDRTWDEEGSKAYEAAKLRDPKKIEITKDELDSAFRFPYLFLSGWAIVALSFLFSRGESSTIDITAVGILSALTALALSVVASLPMAHAVRFRLAKKKQLLSITFLALWVALSVLTFIGAPQWTPSIYFAAGGTACILMSMMFLWKFRKMGNDWERSGSPNPNPVVYNAGGPLFVFGWFLFWIAMASTSPTAVEGDLVLYFNVKTAIAFVAGVGAVVAVFLIDHVHDDGGEFVGFGTDGSHFGRLLETPILFITVWIVLGVLGFLQIDNTFAGDLPTFLVAATATAMGLYVGIFLQTAIYRGNGPLVKKLAMGFAATFFLFAFQLGSNGGAGRYLALIGAAMIVMSQALLMKDRKRGERWMKTGEPNPTPLVYSYGPLAFAAGWICVSWAVSLYGVAT